MTKGKREFPHRAMNFQIQGDAAANVDYDPSFLNHMPASITFEARDADQKAAAFYYSYGGKAPMNYIAIVQTDDSQSLRHGGYQQYRHFDVYVNGRKVQTFSDDHPETNYDSDEYLDRRIDRWLETWEAALGCRAVRGELTNRVRLMPTKRKAGA